MFKLNLEQSLHDTRSCESAKPGGVCKRPALNTSWSRSFHEQISRGDHVNSTSLALSSSDAQGLFQLGSLLLYLNYINKKKFRTLALQIDNYKAFFCHKVQILRRAVYENNFQSALLIIIWPEQIKSFWVIITFP